MNELLFFAHICLIGITILCALQMGASALIAFLSALAIIANLFVLKQITLFGFTATAADVYIVGSVIALNLIQEYFGKAIARKAIWISFFLLVFYTIASQFHLWYQPSEVDTAHEYFFKLLQFMPRITIASMITYLIVQYFDSYLYGFFKKLFAGNYLLLRNYLTIIISQFLDTLLFSFLGLFGILSNLLQVMIISFAIKILVMLLSSPFIIFTKKIMRNKKPEIF
jgi:uncharacterized integral membrane protein (TIGR00697 family)